MVAEDDSERLPLELVDHWPTYGDLPSAVRIAAAPLRRTAFAVGGLLATAVVSALLVIGVSRSADLPAWFAVLPIAMCLGAILTLDILRLRGAGRERWTSMQAARHGMTVYFEGSPPLADRRLVLGRRYLFLISAGGQVSRIPIAEVGTVGLDVRWSGAPVVIALGDRLLPLTVAGRAGGPMPFRWSSDPVRETRAFGRVLLADLQERGIPSAVVDWTGMSDGSLTH